MFPILIYLKTCNNMKLGFVNLTPEKVINKSKLFLKSCKHFASLRKYETESQFIFNLTLFCLKQHTTYSLVIGKLL